jgi:ribosomal protein RSM22 (predicted rRNA methylase)
MQLPPDLKSALETIAEKSGTAVLKTAAQAVSDRYRAKAGANAGIRSDDEARAYLAARFPATYAAALSALIQVRNRKPDFTPESLLDIGAGPGTVTFAALTLWPDIPSLRLLEPNPYLRRAGQELFSVLGLANRVEWIEQRVESAALEKFPSDLVISGYVINEVAGIQSAATIAEKMWQACRDMLVIIEPGTPDGYALMLQARDHLLSYGAFMVAPCPHTQACPLQGKSWCHFSARVERSKLHRAMKENAVLSYEDEKFSYTALSREAVILPQHRVIGYPTGAKIVKLQLCNADGTATTEQIPKSLPHHKLARKAEWGDAVEDSLNNTGG